MSDINTTAPTPTDRVGEDVGRELDWFRKQVVELCEHTEDEMYEALQKDTTNEHEIGFYKGRKLEAKGIRRAICEVVRLRKAELASAPSPDPAGAGGDLGELERLSKAATPGPWAYRPEHLDDWGYIRSTAEGSGELKGEVVATTRGEGHNTHDAHRAAGTDPYEANGRYIVALVNAHRSGQIVASTPGQKGAGEEKTGACLTGYAEFTPISVRSSTGAPASPTGLLPDGPTASRSSGFAAATPSRGWQPISTAPVDGTKFDAWGVHPASGTMGHRFPDVAMRGDGSGFGVVIHRPEAHWEYLEQDGPTYPTWRLTHWRPCPDRPASCDGSAEGGETEGLDPKGNSAVGEAETPAQTPPSTKEASDA